MGATGARLAAAAASAEGLQVAQADPVQEVVVPVVLVLFLQLLEVHHDGP